MTFAKYVREEIGKDAHLRWQLPTVRVDDRHRLWRGRPRRQNDLQLSITKPGLRQPSKGPRNSDTGGGSHRDILHSVKAQLPGDPHVLGDSTSLKKCHAIGCIV